MAISESYIFKLAAIVTKSFREDLTQEEQQILEKWLNATKKDKDLYCRMQREEWLEEKMKESLLIDSEKDYMTFLNRRRQAKRLYLHRMILKYAVVAVLLICAGVGILYLGNVKKSIIPQLADNRVTPDKKQAVLTLGNGNQILLEGIDSVLTKEQDGVLLNIGGHNLSYQKTADSVSRLEYNTLYVPRGGEYYLTLADGTTIWLNSESTLRYPVAFSGNNRMVYLEGEAFFDVTRNERMPFIVVAGGTQTEVLGTEFNLRAYPDEVVVSTTLVEGSVRLTGHEKGQNVILQPGEQGNIVKTNGLVSKHPVDIYQYTAWKDGRLVFRNCRMEDLLKVLSRWYNVEIFFQNSEVRDIRFSGDMCKTEHIDALLNIIENNGLVMFERHEKTVIVRMK